MVRGMAKRSGQFAVAAQLLCALLLTVPSLASRYPKRQLGLKDVYPDYRGGKETINRFLKETKSSRRVKKTSKKTDAPTVSPAPSWSPSISPAPTRAPTARPSDNPTNRPTPPPTLTLVPTSGSSSVPTPNPSKQPTSKPSSPPTRSSQPSSPPTSRPSVIPSVSPSPFPSIQPSSSPSEEPSMSPSSSPSTRPTSKPTSTPSSIPSAEASVPPTLSANPSSAPIASPSSIASKSPSFNPSSLPSFVPTSVPAVSPTITPSNAPSSTEVPTSSPSVGPSLLPSVPPSNSPSSVPSISVAPSLSFSPTIDQLAFDTSFNGNEIIHTCRRDAPAGTTNDDVQEHQVFYKYKVNLTPGTNIDDTVRAGELRLGELLAEKLCRITEGNTIYLHLLSSGVKDWDAGSCVPAGTNCHTFEGSLQVEVFVQPVDQRSLRQLETDTAQAIRDYFEAVIDQALAQLISEISSSENVTVSAISGTRESGSAGSADSGGGIVMGAVVMGGAVGFFLMTVLVIVGAKRRSIQAERRYYEEELDLVNEFSDDFDDNDDTEVPTGIRSLSIVHEVESLHEDPQYSAGLNTSSVAEEAVEVIPENESPTIRIVSMRASLSTSRQRERRSALRELAPQPYIPRNNSSVVPDTVYL